MDVSSLSLLRYEQKLIALGDAQQRATAGGARDEAQANWKRAHARNRMEQRLSIT